MGWVKIKSKLIFPIAGCFLCKRNIILRSLINLFNIWELINKIERIFKILIRERIIDNNCNIIWYLFNSIIRIIINNLQLRIEINFIIIQSELILRNKIFENFIFFCFENIFYIFWNKLRIRENSEII